MTSEPLAHALERLNRLVNWERRERDAMHPGLEPVLDVLARLGDPQRRFRCVHVTGTKGKGTTAALIAAGLVRAGFDTGLYTSPHVERVHERIRIDGSEIQSEHLASCLTAALDARDAAVASGSAGTGATWFDLLTAAAFLAFARAGCTWASIEVGLGGRLDSTNVIDGEVCVVTNVDLEHTNVLGTTRAAIAREKGGIVKRGSTLVTGIWPHPELGPDDDAGSVLVEIAGRLRVPIVRPAREASSALERNLDLARLALDELGRRGVRTAHGAALDGTLLDEATVAAARLPGRGELLWHGRTPVVLDGAHVASSLALVIAEWRARKGFEARPVVVLALARDKDGPAILKTLEAAAEKLVCTTVASGPLRAVRTLVEEASRGGMAVETAASPANALAKAIQLAGDRGWVLVTGSFHLIGAVRPLLTAHP